MAYPAGVQLATLTFSNPITHLGTDADKTEVIIEPSDRIVWAATGQPLDDFPETVAPGAGLPGSITAPCVDQAGVKDAAGNDFTMWAYRITRRSFFGNLVRSVTKTWQPLLGQTTLDFDLLPGGPAGLPVSVAPAPVTSVNGKTEAVTLTKADISLGNVDDTTDAQKPISEAQAEALALKLDDTQLGAANGVAPLGADSKVPSIYLPATSAGAVTSTDITDSTIPGRAVLTAVDEPAARAAIGAGTSSLIIGPTAADAMAGNKVFSKADVGLPNVDNTTDLLKPVSTATQDALDAKISTTAKGVANGVASLGTDGLVPAAQLPASSGGSSYELRGTGMPNGVVTADPGYYYTDSAGTMGAWRWIKKTGTATDTGWEVASGDTGIRDITATHRVGSTVGYIFVRRIDNVTHIWGESLTPATGLTKMTGVLPAGFHPQKQGTGTPKSTQTTRQFGWGAQRIAATETISIASKPT